MNQSELGRVMPFALSGTRLRRSAQEYRRRGQVLEALSLVRRAAEQDDTAAAWQALAAELRQLSCWEAASVVLGRVLSRADRPASAWLDMARCQLAMGQQETAGDCLYHLLYEQPWSPEADTAQALLQDLEPKREEAEPARLPLLMHRAVTTWQQGDRKLGSRRMKRAIRMSPKKARMMTTMALLHMMTGDGQAALRWLTRAMKSEPQEPAAPCSMAALLHQMDRRRIARALLRMAAPLCTDPAGEERFCTAAWAMDAWQELESFVSQRLKCTPHRIPLLQARATMLHGQGRAEAAQSTWRQILAIDPCDRRAATLLTWTKMNPGMMLTTGRLPLSALREQRKLLANAGEGLFRPGSEERRVLDWCAASQESEEQLLAFDTAQKHPDRAGEILWLRELLTRPDVQEPLRQKALMRLAELQHFESVTVLVAERYATAQCQPVSSRPNRKLWRMFLPVFLQVAWRCPQVSESVHFAAKVWERMTPAERKEAASDQAFRWSELILILRLWQEGKAEAAARRFRSLHMPERRIRRMVRRFLPMLDNEPGIAGEGDTER